MISGNLFNQSFAVVFKQDEVANIVEQQFTVKESFNYRFKLPLKQRLVVFVRQRFPRKKTLFVRGKGTNAGVIAVADYQRFVADKQIAEFVFIGL